MPFAKNREVVRKSNFKGENDEFGNDVIYLTHTFTLTLYLAPY